MQFEVPIRPRQVILSGAVLALSLLVCGNAFADSCGVLPFTSGRAVNQGAADNITSLISSEVDIRGGFGLVLTATADELPKGCTKKSSCIVNFGKEEGYERVVSGKVEGLGSSKYRITATLWDVNKGRSIREVEHEMERGGSVLVMAIPDLVVELLTGQAPEDDDEEGSDGVSVFEEVDFDDEEDDTKWMERDRQGRKIRPDGDNGNALDGLDDLDDLDDLDLDDMTEDSQQKKSSKLAERKEREAKRRAEEKRLEELATIEQRRRNEERRRAEDEARERDDRRRTEREEALQESERAEAKRRDRQQGETRRQEDRERAREEERRSERRRAQEQEQEEQRQKEQRGAYADDRDADSYANYELEDDEDVIEIESTISLGGGLVMVEDDDESDYFGTEDEEEREELRPGDIIEYQDGDYTRRAPVPEEDRSVDYRRQDDDRLAYNDRGTPGRTYPNDSLDTDNVDLDSEADEAVASGSGPMGSGTDRGKVRAFSSSAAGASATRRGSKSQRDGPLIAIKAGAGWTAYYPQTLSLGMFNYGFEASFFALPWLTVDAGVNFWAVSLIEYDGLGESVRTVRTLPNFLFGATWHGTFHKVIRPYVGIDLGALLYAQAVAVQDDGSNQIRPLFAPLVAADIGVDFIIIPNFGVYVGGKFGVSYAARVQETVNTSWNPTTGLAEIWAGALVQF